MRFISEDLARSLVTMAEAIEVMERVFLALHHGDAEAFPIVMGHGSLPSTAFSMKAGLIRSSRLVGLKVGTYWPQNRELGLESHGSTTLLLDDATGFPRALISATHLTAMRTAAADAVAVRRLSRPDAQVLGVLGAGHQAWFDVLAACEVRSIRKVLVWSRDGRTAERFAGRITRELGLAAQALELRAVVEGAEILQTVTASAEALVAREWVKPGLHISAMGADARGKQELDPRLVAHARLFADVVDQSTTLGEFEAAFDAGLIDRSAITPLGAVLASAAAGRLSDGDITIFDSSGTALQDLAIGAHVLAAAERLAPAAEVS